METGCARVCVVQEIYSLYTRERQAIRLKLKNKKLMDFPCSLTSIIDVSSRDVKNCNTRIFLVIYYKNERNVKLVFFIMLLYKSDAWLTKFIYIYSHLQPLFEPKINRIHHIKVILIVM